MHHRAKLTSEQVNEMRELYASWKASGSTKGYDTLSELFDCGKSTARDIVQCRTRNENPTIKGYNKMRFAIAAEARQIILDTLNADPTKDRVMDMVAAGVNRNRAESCIVTMLALGELEKTGKGLTARYKALVRTTMSADDMRQYVLAQQMAGRKLAPPPREVDNEPWRYKHRPDKDGHIRPTQQGGQGSLRRQVYIGSVLA